MAKNLLGKLIAGVAVIGAGVAVGLTIYNKLDEASRDFDDFDDDILDEETEVEEPTYVTLNISNEEAKDDVADVEEEAEAEDDSAKEEE